MVNVLLTYSAPAERASDAEVAADHQKLLQEPLVQQLLDSLPEPAMILNPQRQVVLADGLAALLNAEPEQLLGRRPGEILHCIHSQECAGGCGTSKFCAQCGAGRAIWESQTTNTAQARECRMTCATWRRFAVRGPEGVGHSPGRQRAVHGLRRPGQGQRETSDSASRQPVPPAAAPCEAISSGQGANVTEAGYLGSGCPKAGRAIV